MDESCSDDVFSNQQRKGGLFFAWPPLHDANATKAHFRQHANATHTHYTWCMAADYLCDLRKLSANLDYAQMMFSKKG